MNKSEQINELAAALAKAQGKIKGAIKDSVNPHFKSKFADLASVWDAARESLSANGLAVVQPASAEGARVVVTTLLLHSSGQWISEELAMTAAQNTPQGIGGAVTYARRYALAAMVGIAQEDDDGNSATRHEESSPGKTVTKVKTRYPAAEVYAGTDAHKRLLMEAFVKEGLDRRHLLAVHDACLKNHVEVSNLTNAVKDWQVQQSMMS